MGQFPGKIDSFLFFSPNLPKNLSVDLESAPLKYPVCQFLSKTDKFEFFHLNLGNDPITCDILVIIMLRELKGTQWRLK